MRLRYLLLVMLMENPNSGYGLARLMKTEHMSEAKLQQIYVGLARLLSDGLLSVEVYHRGSGPPKKMYSVTEAGEAALRLWLEESPRHMHKDELIIQLLVADHFGRSTVTAHISDRMEATSTRVAELEAQLSDDGRRRPGEVLALEAELYRARAEIAWCQRASAVLSSGTIATTR